MKNFTKQITNNILFKPTRWILLALMLLLGTGSAWGAKLYFKPSTTWKTDNARFAAYFFGNGDKWVSMTASTSRTDFYEVDAPNGYPNVIFCRMNPSATANNWNNKWNQTDDLNDYANLGNTYTRNEDVWDGNGGTWSCYENVTEQETYNYDFGDVGIGESKTLTFKFDYIASCSGINPSFLDAGVGFSLVSSSTDNNVVTFEVKFEPTSEGKKTATLQIAWINGGILKKTITANGIVACEPTATLKSASYNATTKKIDLSGSMDPCGKDLYYGFLWRKQGDKWVADNAHAISGTGNSYNNSSEPKEFSQSWSDFEPGSTYEFTAYALDATTSKWYYNEEGIEVSTCIDVQTPSVTASATKVCQGGEVTLTLANQQDDVTYTVNGTKAFTDANEFTATNLQSDITYTIVASSTTACTNDPKQAEVNITVLKQSFNGAYIGFKVPAGSNAASYTACDDVTLQTWIQGATQYTIYENDVEIETGDATGKTTDSTPITYTITGKSAGTYVYKVVYKDACDNTFTTGTITLTVPATIDAPKYTLTQPSQCNNEPTDGLLEVTKVEGISYTISPALDGSVDDGWPLTAVDHTAEKTYTITATKTTGSCTRTATTEVPVQTIDNTPVVNDIAITTANTTVCAGSELTLQLVGDAQDGVSFQWYKDEDAIVGATSSSLTIQNVTASDAGKYKLVASKTTPCTVTKVSEIKTISVDAQSKIEVSAAESFCLGFSVILTSKVTDATGTVTWYTDQAGTQPVDNTTVTVNDDATYYAKAQNGVCPATDAVAYTITAKGATISKDIETVHPYEVTTFTASKEATWELTTNPAEGDELSADDPTFSGKTTAYITKAAGTTITFKGEAATGYTISATAEECTTTQTFNVVVDPDNCK